MELLDFDPEQPRATVAYQYGTFLNSDKELIVHVNRRDWLVFSGRMTVAACAFSFGCLMLFVGFSDDSWTRSGALILGKISLLVAFLIFVSVLCDDRKFKIELSEQNITIQSWGITSSILSYGLDLQDIAKVILVEYRHREQKNEIRLQIKNHPTKRQAALSGETISLFGQAHNPQSIQYRLNHKISLLFAEKISHLSGAPLEHSKEIYPGFDYK